MHPGSFRPCRMCPIWGLFLIKPSADLWALIPDSRHSTVNSTHTHSAGGARLIAPSYHKAHFQASSASRGVENDFNLQKHDTEVLAPSRVPRRLNEPSAHPDQQEEQHRRRSSSEEQAGLKGVCFHKLVLKGVRSQSRSCLILMEQSKLALNRPPNRCPCWSSADSWVFSRKLEGKVV